MFRLGDFYEMFFEDAKTAAPILNVALTKRNGIPMCGVPHQRAELHCQADPRGEARGDRGADERAGPGKLVEREIRPDHLAGSIETDLLDEQRPNYLAAVYPEEKRRPGLSWITPRVSSRSRSSPTGAARLMSWRASQPVRAAISDEQIAIFGALRLAKP